MYIWINKERKEEEKVARGNPRKYKNLPVPRASLYKGLHACFAHILQINVFIYKEQVIIEFVDNNE